MKKLSSLFVVSLLAATAISQPQAPDTVWTRTFGGSDMEIGLSVKQTVDGGYIITGETESYGAGNGDVYLIKIDSQGNEQWHNTFGGSSEEWGREIKQTTDGGFIIVGVTLSFGAGSWDVYLIKTDSLGNEQWHRTYGGSNFDEGYDVELTPDGGYIIVGETGSFGAGTYDVYLVRTDGQGNQQWFNTFGGIDQDEGYSIQITSDGGYIISGWTLSFGAGDRDFYLVKTDSQGNQQWYRTYGGIEVDEGHCVQQTCDSGFIIVGATESYGSGSYDVYLVKTDSQGNLLWDRTFGGTDLDGGFKVEQTSDGGFIITGLTWSYGAGDCDVYLIKADSIGNEQWSATYGSIEFDGGYSVQQTSDGGYIISGTTGPYFITGTCDAYLIRLAPELVVEDNTFSLSPLAFSLNCSPNPFNQTLAISYQLPAESEVELKVFDISGREVASIVNDQRSTGKQQLEWDAEGIPSGIYFIRLSAIGYQLSTFGGQSIVRKVVLLK